MRSTLDVNVLVYAADRGSDRHERARALLQRVATESTITYLFWPVLLGYLRIVTHPSIVAAPIPPQVAIEAIDDLIDRPQIVVAGEEDRFWGGFKHIVETVRPRGTLVPGAHLVALMREHGVTTIWTADRDFHKFDGITVIDPFA